MATHLLLETADSLLLEAGGNLLLEAVDEEAWRPTDSIGDEPDPDGIIETLLEQYFVQPINPIPQPAPPVAYPLQGSGVWDGADLTEDDAEPFDPISVAFVPLPTWSFFWLPSAIDLDETEDSIETPHVVIDLGSQLAIPGFGSWTPTLAEYEPEEDRQDLLEAWLVSPLVILGAADCLNWRDETLTNPGFSGETLQAPTFGAEVLGLPTFSGESLCN